MNITGTPGLLKRVRARGAVPLDSLGMQRPLAETLLARGMLGIQLDPTGRRYVYIPYDWPTLKPKPPTSTTFHADLSDWRDDVDDGDAPDWD